MTQSVLLLEHIIVMNLELHKITSIVHYKQSLNENCKISSLAVK
jgi:hypothetical protein